MSARIALDTNVIIGMLDEQDLWRKPTLTLLAALENNNFEPVVLDCVLTEAISTLARRTHEKHRAAQLSSLLKKTAGRVPDEIHRMAVS